MGHSGCLVGNGADGEGNRGHRAAITHAEAQDIIAPPRDPNGRQEATTGARVGSHEHGVAEVVADDRLDPVGQVGQEYRVGGLPGRGGAEILIDGLKNCPVPIYVQPVVGAVEGNEKELRSPVDIVDLAVERRRHARADLGRRRLACDLREDGRSRAYRVLSVQRSLSELVAELEAISVMQK